jgi:hypothetical protein
MAEDLKRKDFTVSMPLADKEIVGTGFLQIALSKYRKAAPLVQFLSEAVRLV